MIHIKVSKTHRGAFCGEFAFILGLSEMVFWGLNNDMTNINLRSQIINNILLITMTVSIEKIISSNNFFLFNCIFSFTEILFKLILSFNFIMILKNGLKNSKNHA